ncbi:hypothetical protein [Peribacillus simplex]|uniref:hypothetical protein n=1 Tax=Peribacillus simplex TaxID=1478 RepID=UPI003CFE348F
MEVRWNTNNIRHYRSFGYTFTHKGDTFTVPVKHLPPYQKTKNLIFQCDYCGKEFPRSNNDYTQIKKRTMVEKDSCKECKGQKQKETTITKQDKGLLTPQDNGYWTIHKNRLKELKGYIEDRGTLLHLYSDPKGNKIWRAFHREHHSIKEALEELGYSAGSLSYKENEYTIPLIFHGFYNDFANVESEIKKFIASHNSEKTNYFPTIDDLFHTLHMSKRAIQHHGGICKIREKMGYTENNPLIDDAGWLNKSAYEWKTAQYLIHNTKIPYKREQYPFPGHEGFFRSDFTFYPEESPEIHVEVWGSGNGQSDREKEYQTIKKRKIDLYNKYKIRLISVEKSHFNRNIEAIQDKFHELFSPFIQLKYKRIDNDYLIIHSDLNDKELLKKIMTLSDDPNVLPTVPVLKQHNQYKLYQEVIRRFDSYITFGETFGKKTSRVKENHWTKDRLYEALHSTLKKGHDLSQESLRVHSPRELAAMGKHGGLIAVKIDYYEMFIDKIKGILPYEEKKFLMNVCRNQGTNIMNRLAKDQRKRAQRVVERIHSDVSALFARWEEAGHKPLELWDEAKIFDFFVKILADGEPIQRRVLQKYRFYRLLETVQEYGGIITLKLKFYGMRIDEIESLPAKEIEWIQNISRNQGKNIAGMVNSDQQRQALELLSKLKYKNVLKHIEK